MYLKTCNNFNFMDGQQIVIDCMSKEVVGVNLELKKSNCGNFGIICGKVINKLGEPIQHALVKVVTETYDAVFHTKTDGEGNYFIFDVPTHKYFKLIAIAEQYQLSEEIKVCLSEHEILTINFSLSHCESEVGVITGTIFNKTNSLPINKAYVILFEKRDGEEFVKEITRTNEFGLFTLTRLSIGNYIVKISMPGYIGEQYIVNITNCIQISNHVISLTPDNTISKGAVSGVITDQNKRPVPEADVILYKVEQDGCMKPIAYARANRDGAYLFINVETGSYKIMAK